MPRQTDKELADELDASDRLRARGYAWKSCPKCHGCGHNLQTGRCFSCDGEGGRWEAPTMGMREGHSGEASDEYDDDDCCPMCDGMVMLSECWPSEWGEDCFCEVDRVVACHECLERERYEAMRKQQEAKRPNDALCEVADKARPN